MNRTGTQLQKMPMYDSCGWSGCGSKICCARHRLRHEHSSASERWERLNVRSKSTNPDWRIEWKSRLSETDSSEYSPFDSVYMLMHRNTRPICELYFQYTRVLIFLLMRFLSIFYRIEQCASVCVQLRLFSISFVRLDRLVWFGCFFPFILHLSTLECDIRCVRLYACLYVCMYE